MRAYTVAITLAFTLACGGNCLDLDEYDGDARAFASTDPAGANAAASDAKPRYVPCDPARPDLPCTPDAPPPPPTKAAPTKAPPAPVKPRYVPCDPARPDLPCTPDAPPPPPTKAAPTKAAPTPVKPRHVPCDPARPDLPCTPDAPPPTKAMPTKGAPDGSTTLRDAYPPPAGTQRLAGDAFATWLGAMRVLPPSVPVRTHDGKVVAGHKGARVIDLPMVPGNLQQCADALIRVRAEWLRATGGEVMYHATSGDPIPWTRWQAGERPFEQGRGLAWRPGDRGGWEAYLAAVMRWAGTASLAAYDTDAVQNPKAGDVLVMGGYPGHAVMLLDVVKRGSDHLALIGESYMPAMNFHVEPGPIDGWWSLNEGVRLPHWDMRGAPLRRWKR